MLREKDGKGIVVERNGTHYSRKASADQSSPRVKALQGCISDKTTGMTANTREDWRDKFERIVKECKEEVSL